MRPRVVEFMRSLKQAAMQARATVVQTVGVPAGDGVLIAYGAGAPATADIVAKHVQAGRPAICWDVGYWGRSFRFAIDGHHPKALPVPPADRPIPDLREDYDPSGHIVLIGLGPKSRYMDSEWEYRALAKIQEHYPGRRIVYRPKPNREFMPLPVETDNNSSIECVLRGASLVVCRHSNVGVDAAIAGIPVVSDMGTPTLLYGSDIAKPKHPTREQRETFLRALAWLNWQDGEAKSQLLLSWILQCSERYMK